MNHRVIFSMCLLFFCSCLYANIPDPTKPPKKTAPKKTVETEILRLKMIKLDRKTGEHTANINGEFKKIGQTYADAKVVAITSNTVELLGPKGESIILTLIKDDPKKVKGSGRGKEVFPDVKTKGEAGK